MNNGRYSGYPHEEWPEDRYDAGGRAKGASEMHIEMLPPTITTEDDLEGGADGADT